MGVGDGTGDEAALSLAAFAVACCSRSASDCNRSLGTVGSWILLWSDLSEREHAPNATMPLKINAIKIVFIVSEQLPVGIRKSPLLACGGCSSNHKKSAARSSPCGVTRQLFGLGPTATAARSAREPRHEHDDAETNGPGSNTSAPRY